MSDRLHNVVHVISQLDCGGSEKQLFTLACALKDRGWRQTVITFRPDGVYQGRLAASGIAVKVVPITRSKLWRFCCFQWLVARARPTIIHSWSVPTHKYVRWPQWPVIARTLFELRYDPINDVQTGLRVDQRKTLRHFETAHYVVSNSEVALSRLSELGIKPRRREIVRNMIVSLGRGRPGEDSGLPRIAAAGTLKPLKGYDVLLRALALLAKEGVRSELLLAGEGPQRGELETLAAELGLTESVRFLGHVADVPSLFASAHVVVHPSYSEALSNSILEAMGEGIPVIATRVGGSPEMVEDGNTGLLVPPGCPTSIMQALQKLLADSDLRTRLGSAGLTFVRKNCSIDKNVRQYEDIYLSLLAAHNKC
jgi:glycosyltransferase involved in cell wall biosynthesis